MNIGILGLIFLTCLPSLSAAQTETRAVGSAAMTVVTFGTSLTARGGWQAPLAQKLSSCLAKPVSVEIVAQSGATSDWGLAHINGVVNLRPDIVVIEFYANDAKLFSGVSVSRSRQNIGEILTRLKEELPHARLIVQIMNPISGIRGMLRPFMESYVQAHLRQAEALGAEIVDHRSTWLKMSKAELAEAIPDGAHPALAPAATVIVPALARQIGGALC